MNTRDAWNTDLEAPRWDDLPRVEQMRLGDFAGRIQEDWPDEALEEIQGLHEEVSGANERITELEEELAKLESLRVPATVAP